MKNNACADCKYMLSRLAKPGGESYLCTHSKHTQIKFDVVTGVSKIYPSCRSIRNELGSYPCSFYKPTIIAFFRDLL